VADFRFYVTFAAEVVGTRREIAQTMSANVGHGESHTVVADFK